MRFMNPAILATALAFGANFAAGLSSAMAQGGGLGGYGATSGGTGTSVGAGSVAPFGGRFATVMPSGTGGGGGISFRPRPSATMSGTRTAFTIGPMGGGFSGGMGSSSARRPFVLRDLGPSGFSGLRRPMPSVVVPGVMPPNFGSPFRQPPSLVDSASPGAGMSP